MEIITKIINDRDFSKESKTRLLDIILNDVELMERVFSDRDDISDLQKAAQRQKKYLSVKEIAEIERKLNEEFGLIEDRRQSQSTYKKSEETTE
jgi:hypothetical protein